MLFILNNTFGIITACIAGLLFIIIRKKLNYFTDRGLIFMKTSFIEQISLFSLSKSFRFCSEVYERSKGKNKQYTGFFSSFLKPGFVLLDCKLIEKILIKDFSHFQDHGMDIDIKLNPLFGHLFSMKGDQWRTLRNKLLPTFTSGKLKGMIPVMEQCADNLIERMKRDHNLRNDANLEFFKDYSLAVTAITAFGLDPEGFNDGSDFKRIAQEALLPDFFTKIKMSISILLPKVAKLLKVKMSPPEVEKFFFNLTRDALEMRKKSGVKRNDFIQLLLELKEKGSVEIDTKDLEEDEKEIMKEIQSHKSSTKLELSNELLTAQVFVFLVAGYENSAYIVEITAYLLSKNPHIQNRVREEIREMKNKHGKIDYLALKDMKLLSACVDESLRLYTASPTIMRVCNKTYALESGEVIEKGSPVLIAADSVHRDSRYWKNPEQFHPDRFLEGKIQPGTYLPFGDGPRICIAQRLALVTAKMMLAKLIDEFEIFPCSKTQEPLLQTSLRSTEIVGGLWANFKQLHSS